ADATGEKKALEAATLLHGVARTIRIVRLPGLTGAPNSKDVSDWLDADPRNADKLVDVCFDTPSWSPESERPEQEKPESKSESEQLPPLPFINMSNWDNEPISEQEWAVFNRIPLRQCVLFSGEGAAGKSILQLQLSAAHVLARDWLNAMPETGP